jgi:hypothetical protein
MDNAAAAAPVEEETEVTTDWKEEFGLAGNPQFDKFESPADLAKSYAELEHYRGSSIRIPSSEAGEEQLNEFTEKLLQVPGVTRIPAEDDKAGWDNIYQQLGRPGEAKGYKFDEVEGFSDPEAEGELKALAHELGLSNTQAAAIHKHLATNIATESSAQAEVAEKSMAELKGEWGQAFEHKMGQAQIAAAQLEKQVPGISEYFDNMAAKGMDANMIRLMDVVSGLMSETGAVPSAPSVGVTREEARAKLQDIRDNPNHPANNDMDPQYENARKEVIKLYKAAYD